MKLELDDADVQRIAEAIVERLRYEAPKPMPEYLSTKEAAKVLGVHENTVLKMVASGELPRLPGVRSHRIPAAALRGGDTTTEARR